MLDVLKKPQPLAILKTLAKADARAVDSKVLQSILDNHPDSVTVDTELLNAVKENPRVNTAVQDCAKVYGASNVTFEDVVQLGKAIKNAMEANNLKTLTKLLKILTGYSDLVQEEFFLMSISRGKNNSNIELFDGLMFILLRTNKPELMKQVLLFIQESHALSDEQKKIILLQKNNFDNFTLLQTIVKTGSTELLKDFFDSTASILTSVERNVLISQAFNSALKSAKSLQMVEPLFSACDAEQQKLLLIKFSQSNNVLWNACYDGSSAIKPLLKMTLQLTNDNDRNELFQPIYKDYFRFTDSTLIIKKLIEITQEDPGQLTPVCTLMNQLQFSDEVIRRVLESEKSIDPKILLVFTKKTTDTKILHSIFENELMQKVKLQKYIDMRDKELEKPEIGQYHRWSFFGFSADTKKLAATKELKRLNGDKTVKLTYTERMALNTGRLAAIPMLEDEDLSKYSMLGQ